MRKVQKQNEIKGNGGDKMNYKTCEKCGATLDLAERCYCYRLEDPAEREYIRTLYKQSADKEKQIDILCELYDTSRKIILEILGDTYVPAKRRQERANTARIRALAIAYAAAGENNATIAQRLGISETYASFFAAPVRKAAKKPKDPLEELCGG